MKYILLNFKSSLQSVHSVKAYLCLFWNPHTRSGNFSPTCFVVKISNSRRWRLYTNSEVRDVLRGKLMWIYVVKLSPHCALLHQSCKQLSCEPVGDVYMLCQPFMWTCVCCVRTSRNINCVVNCHMFLCTYPSAPLMYCPLWFDFQRSGSCQSRTSKL